MRALCWPLFALSAWAQPGIVVADTTYEAFFRTVRVGIASTVVAGTTGEGVALASLISIVVDSANQCGGGTTDGGALQASVSWSAWNQTATVVVCTKSGGAALPSVHLPAWPQPDTVVSGTT